MKPVYQIHEFAQLAGVTVKALRHYDRLGLLNPMRSDAGYRVYTARDLDRLEQIVALKFIGVPLSEIKLLLDRDVLGMTRALRLQRRVIEQKRHLLDQALKAIEEAEHAISQGDHANARATQAIKTIIKVISMQHDTNFLKKYYNEEAWAKWRRSNQGWPSQEMIDLLSDAQQALEENPESEIAQALAARWVRIRIGQADGDPAVIVALTKAWADRKNWPPGIAEKAARLDLEGISRLLGRATMAYRKKYYTDEAWLKLMQETPEEFERRSIEWLELHLEAGSLLDEDPTGDRAQALAARWMVLVDRSTRGDLELRAGSSKAWADRQNWPPAVREQVASLNLEKISAFLAQAFTAHERKYYSADAWEKRTSLRRQRDPDTSQNIGTHWNALFGDVREALGDDPGSERAQELARRWMALVEETTGGDTRIRQGAIKAWQDRNNWPEWKQRQMAGPPVDEVSAFIARAIDWPLRKYFDEETWAKRVDSGKHLTAESLDQVLDRRAALFADVKEAIGEDPFSERAQAIAIRWGEMRQSEAGGDAEMLAGKARAWADRENWPEPLRLKEAGSYLMNERDFAKAADFIDAVVEARRLRSDCK